MPPTDDNWSEADFEPRERVWSSFEELHASVFERIDEGILDPQLNEDLRLFICVRLIQKKRESEIADELNEWGLDQEYTLHLARTTKGAGQFGIVEVYSEVEYVYGTAVWKNPAYEVKKHLAIRAGKRWKLAYQLLGMASVENEPIDLGFTPDSLPSAISPVVLRALRRRKLFAVYLAILLLGGALVGLKRLFD